MKVTERERERKRESMKENIGSIYESKEQKTNSNNLH